MILSGILNFIRSPRTSLRLRALRQWSPRPYQLPLWRFLEHGGKRACVVWHRRSGKDAVAMNWACEFLHRRIGEVWHFLPEAAQARKAVWDAVDPHTGRRRIDQAFPPELRAKTRDNEMSIQFKNGSLWRVVGSDNYESLIGSTPMPDPAAPPSSRGRQPGGAVSSLSSPARNCAFSAAGTPAIASCKLVIGSTSSRYARGAAFPPNHIAEQ
jgi:hypothetical protein